MGNRDDRFITWTVLFVFAAFVLLVLGGALWLIEEWPH